MLKKIKIPRSLNVVIQQGLSPLWFVVVCHQHRIWGHMLYRLHKDDFHRPSPHGGEGWGKWPHALLQSTNWTLLHYEVGPERLQQWKETVSGVTRDTTEVPKSFILILQSENRARKSLFPMFCCAYRPTFLVIERFLNWLVFTEELEKVCCVTAI